MNDSSHRDSFESDALGRKPAGNGDAGRGMEYLSTGEAARQFGVSRQTILRWTRDGHLPASQTAGGHIRVPRSAIQRLLSSGAHHIATIAESAPPIANGQGSHRLPLFNRPRRLRVCAVVQGRYGHRIVKNLTSFGPANWTIESIELPLRLPAHISDAGEYLDDLRPADLVLALGEDPAVAELIPEVAARTGARSVLAPVDRADWLPEPIQQDLITRLGIDGVSVVIPGPFCTLTEQCVGYRHSAQQYEDDNVREFGSFFGRPSFRLGLDANGRTITEVVIDRDAPCGCARYVVEHLLGSTVEEAEQKAGLLHHHFPCLASMHQQQIDEALRDTLQHVSGHVLKSAVDNEVRAFRRPASYVTP